MDHHFPGNCVSWMDCEGEEMNHPRAKLLLLSGVGLMCVVPCVTTNPGAGAFFLGLGTSLSLTSYAYLLVNSDQNEPKKLKIKTIEKICNVHIGKWGPCIKRSEILIAPKEGKYYAYKNDKYLGMIHHFTSTLNNEKSEAIYAKDGYVFIEW